MTYEDKNGHLAAFVHCIGPFLLPDFIQWFGHFSQNKLYELRKLFKNNRLYFYTQFHKLL